MVVKYLEQGDIVLAQHDPALGHEQKGTRPSLVVSHSLYNKRSNTVVLCPITSTRREHPFEVVVESADNKTQGYILIDHIKTFDTKERKLRKLGKVTNNCLAQVQGKIEALLVIK
jgi:mRNA interferase MazF